MANAYVSTTTWADFVANAYDVYVRFQLRSRPVFRQFVDVHPVAPTIDDAPSVTLNIAQEFAALATTPLSETTDPDSVAPPEPVQVTVSVDEYGSYTLTTLKLLNTAYTQINPVKANLVGKNMIDTVDKLVQNVADTGTQVIGKNATVVKTNASAAPFAVNAVAAGDKLDSTLINNTTTLLRGRNAMGYDANENFIGLVHPDVSNDIKSDTGWLNPHAYQDTKNIYNAEVGTYLGVRFLETPRAKVAANAGAGSTVDVYSTYVIGREVFVEAVITNPGLVVGPQIDPLRRRFPLGWYGHLGHAMFRQECLETIKTSSSVQSLS